MCTDVWGVEPVTVYPAMRILAAYVLAPMAVVALGTGLLLAARPSPGMLRQFWVLAKLSITTALTALVLLVVIPGLAAAENAARESAVTERVQLIYTIAPAATLSLLLVNVALAVYKPRQSASVRGRGAIVN